MEHVDARIAKIEQRRKRELWKLRGVSMGILVFSFVYDVIDNLANFWNFVQPQWILTIIGIVMNIISISFEYFVRWRQPLVEGPSEHLAEIRQSLRNAYTALGNLQKARREPFYANTGAVAEEEARLNAIISNLEARITFKESTVSVIAPAPRIVSTELAH